jgi:hypothetical protein
MKAIAEQQLIEMTQNTNNAVKGIDKGMAYLITGMQKLLEQSNLSLKYDIITANNGTPHKIGGYVHGRTSNGDPFVLLYPAKKTLKHKITRVYEQSFDDLPWFIETNHISNDAQDGNPDKDKAKKQGIYHECDWFEIATIDGKETQMGPEQRYFMTIKIYNQKSEQPPPSNEPAGQPAEQFEPPTIQHDQAEAKLNAIIGEGLDELTEPFAYQDGTVLADNPKLHAIFKAYWEAMKEIAANGSTLKLWYADNKELVNA